MRNIALLTFILFSLSVHGVQDLILKKNEVVSISDKDITYDGKEYHVKYRRMRLDQGSSLVISSRFAGDVLNIKIEELTALGSNQIIQPFSETFLSPNDVINVNYYSDHPRAQSGKDAEDKKGTAQGSDNGEDGEDGSDGKFGKSSVHLKIVAGIKRVDDLRIILKSESGGNGGNGGRGQKGGRGECTNGDGGGNGGRGGNGGAGAAPGRVNDIEITWYELAPIFSTKNDIPIGLSIYQIPGSSGAPGGFGIGGDGGDGKACFPAYSRSGGHEGPNGNIGKFPSSEVDSYFGSVGKISVKKVLR